MDTNGILKKDLKIKKNYQMKYINKIKNFIQKRYYDTDFWFYAVSLGVLTLWYLCYLYSNLSL